MGVCSWLGKWTGKQPQPVVRVTVSCVASSVELADQLQGIQVASKKLLFIADACSMCTNAETNHALVVLHHFPLHGLGLSWNSLFHLRVCGFSIRSMQRLGDIRIKLLNLRDQDVIVGFSSVLRFGLHANSLGDSIGNRFICGSNDEITCLSQD